jgi:methionyl-tRNA formyltransferase
VDWTLPAAVIERRMRAFDPFPGVSCVMHGEANSETIKLWQAQVDPVAQGAPGTVLSADAQGLCVACGQGALRITQLQRPGGKRVSAADFLRSFALQPGQSLTAAA